MMFSFRGYKDKAADIPSADVSPDLRHFSHAHCRKIRHHVDFLGGEDVDGLPRRPLLAIFAIMKIIIADDNNAVRSSLKILLARTFDKIVTTADPSIIPALLDAGDVDAILLDMNFDPAGSLDGRDGLFWLERIMSADAHPAVVVITAFGDVNLAVEAMKLGADDFITKPWDNDDLIAKLLAAIGRRRRACADARCLDAAAEAVARSERRDAMTLDELKTDHIRRVIEQTDGNLSLAAERLGINRQTLYNHLKRIKP